MMVEPVMTLEELNRFLDTDFPEIHTDGKVFEVVSVATGTVDNVKQLERMTDAEIQQVFEGAARSCGRELVVRVRKHAS